MRMLNTKTNDPAFMPGVHKVTIAVPPEDAVRMVQHKLDMYTNHGRIVGQSAVTQPCTVGRRTTYIYETTVTYEVYD